MIKLNQDNVIENYVIISNITFLGAFTFLFSLNSFDSDILKIILLTSVISLSSSFILLLWNKFRYPVRQELFNAALSEAEEDYEKSIDIFLEKSLEPSTLKILNEKYGVIIENKEYFNLGDKDATKKIQQVILDEIKAQEPLLKLILKKYAADVWEAKQRYLKAPLSEKFSKIKYVLDLISQSYRYHFFIIGLFLFILSLLLKFY